MTFDNPKKSAENKMAANLEPSNLQSEAWNLQTAGKAEQKPRAHEHQGKSQIAEIDRLYGNEANYLVKAPLELRQQYGLGKQDSSEKVYHAMAKDCIASFPQLDAAEKQKGLESLKLTASDMKDESKIFSALVNRDRSDAGLPVLTVQQMKAAGGAAITESENAMHKSIYARAKKDGVAVDYN